MGTRARMLMDAKLSHWASAVVAMANEGNLILEAWRTDLLWRVADHFDCDLAEAPARVRDELFAGRVEEFACEVTRADLLRLLA